MSLIEAQAANLPIVSTNVGGIENVIIEGETALLSDVTNELAFFENLALVVNDNHLRKSMQQCGWNHVQSKFSYNRLAFDMKQLYFELLEADKK